MWRVRDFHADDLDAAVRLWEDPASSSEAPLFGLSDLIAAVRSHQPTVVAVVGEELAGVAVATVTGDQAWVMRISLAAAWRRRGIGSAMLGELERRLVTAGVRRIVCLLAANSETGPLALEHSGFSARREMVLYERVEPVGPGSAGILDQLGGRMVRAGAWDRLGGMVKEKELIERRVILPLAQPQLAERLGLVPPRAIVLFGPPGTGKTSFARGAASQLGWPFVELFPSRLAGESPAGLAAALREAFALVAELDKVVLFIDEVEEIAGSRQPRTVSAAQGVTNEMLKLIPAFREQDERLLICATNSVRALDSAFLRHGRFDYVLPIGPPDPAARQAIWDRYLAAVPHGELDMAAIVEESQLFTPADIEFAARRTAQLAFERVLFEHGKELVTTDDIRPRHQPDPAHPYPGTRRRLRAGHHRIRPDIGADGCCAAPTGVRPGREGPPSARPAEGGKGDQDKQYRAGSGRTGWLPHRASGPRTVGAQHPAMAVHRHRAGDRALRRPPPPSRIRFRQGRARSANRGRDQLISNSLPSGSFIPTA